MVRPLVLAVLAVSALAGPLIACAPVTALNGFQAIDVRPQDVKIGVDTRDTVRSRLGSPSTVAAFDPNIWYYVTQISDKVAYLNPQIKSRSIVAISFDKDQKVAEVRSLGLGDGYDLAYNKRETPTRGRELSVIEQLLGNVGRGGLPNQSDNDPGQRPGQGPTGGPH